MTILYFDGLQRMNRVFGHGGIQNSILKKRGFADPYIVLKWREIVGQDLAKVFVPTKISGNAVLEVQTKSLYHFTNFNYFKHVMVERINISVGYQAISSIKIKYLEDLSQVNLK